ncbi:hypothetical protein, partial [Fibrobacter sp.]|uniref:hypothetical protein n=1 Tax=Fibrobacter sp. TaxID=35828 RepID=UPI0025B9068C
RTLDCIKLLLRHMYKFIYFRSFLVWSGLKKVYALKYSLFFKRTARRCRAGLLAGYRYPNKAEEG